MRRAMLSFAALFVLLSAPTYAQAPECAGIAGLQCKGALWCELQDGTCMIADAGGQCAEVPEVCTQNEQPVCGCDRETYSNDCKRRMAKVSKDHDGPCIK